MYCTEVSFPCCKIPLHWMTSARPFPLWMWLKNFGSSCFQSARFRILLTTSKNISRKSMWVMITSYFVFVATCLFPESFTPLKRSGFASQRPEMWIFIFSIFIPARTIAAPRPSAKPSGKGCTPLILKDRSGSHFCWRWNRLFACQSMQLSHSWRQMSCFWLTGSLWRGMGYGVSQRWLLHRPNRVSDWIRF